MLLVSMDSRLVGGLFIVFVVGWVLFKIVDSMSGPSNNVSDTRPTCNRCGDLLPTGEKKCISCGYEPSP